MSEYLRYKKGELRERALQDDLLQKLVFAEDACDLHDIEITTLRQYLRDEASIEALASCMTLDEVEYMFEELLCVKYTHAAEFVWVHENKIVVGVDAIEVDDHAIDRALRLMTQVDDITEQQFTTLGEEIRIYGQQN